MYKSKSNRKKNEKGVSFKREWPLLVILKVIRKYQDRRAHLVRFVNDKFEIRYSVFIDRRWVRRNMGEKEIYSLFYNLYN